MGRSRSRSRSHTRSRSRSRGRRRSRSYSRSRSRSSSPDSYRQSLAYNRVHVADLGLDPSKREIEKAFEKFGPLIEVWVARNPPCFAFVVYKYKEDADNAIREMDGQVLSGGRIRCSYARPRVRGGGPRRRGGFDASLRCYQCGERGHFSRDCDEIWRQRRRNRERRRSPRRSYSRSRSRERERRRTRSRSRERRRSKSRSRSRERKRKTSRRDSRSRSRSRSRSKSRRAHSSSKSPRREREEKSKSKSKSPEQNGNDSPDRVDDPRLEVKEEVE